MTMKKALGFGAIALSTALVLTGCTTEETPEPTPEPTVEETPGFEAAIVPFASRVADAQFELYAPNNTFPDDAPAYVILGPNDAIVFLGAFPNDECVMELAELTREGDAVRVTLTANMNAEDCGDYGVTKPYGLSIGSDLHFDDVRSLEFCFEDNCKFAQFIELEALPDEPTVIIPEITVED